MSINENVYVFLNNVQILLNLHNLNRHPFNIKVSIYLPLFLLHQKIINDYINVKDTLFLDRIYPKDLILICTHQRDLDDINILQLLHPLFHPSLHLILDHLFFNPSYSHKSLPFIIKLL